MSHVGSLMTSVCGSNAAICRFCLIRTELKATRRPSAEKQGWAANVAGVVTGSGSPLGRPDSSSTGIRHRFMLPPRSLMK